MSSLETFKEWLAFLTPLVHDPPEDPEGQTADHPTKKAWADCAENLKTVHDSFERAAQTLELIAAAADPADKAASPTTPDEKLRAAGSPRPEREDTAVAGAVPGWTSPVERHKKVKENASTKAERDRLRARVDQLAEQATDLASTADGLKSRARVLARRAGQGGDTAEDAIKSAGMASRAAQDAARAKSRAELTKSVLERVRHLRELIDVPGLGDAEKERLEEQVRQEVARVTGGVRDTTAKDGESKRDLRRAEWAADRLQSGQGSLETARKKVDGLASPDDATVRFVGELDVLAERALLLRTDVEAAFRD